MQEVFSPAEQRSFNASSVPKAISCVDIEKVVTCKIIDSRATSTSLGGNWTVLDYMSKHVLPSLANKIALSEKSLLKCLPEFLTNNLILPLTGVNFGIGSQMLADDPLTSPEGIRSSTLVPSATIDSEQLHEMSSSNPSSSAARERLDERPPLPDSFCSNVSSLSDIPPSTSLTKWKEREQLEKSSANEEYEVEDIIGFRWNHDGLPEWLIKWKVDPTKPTWELEENLFGCPHMLSEFNDTHEMQKALRWGSTNA
ncbi:hypothetical protein L208DRAFT_1378178 [Tricholoma matsutake]|nr:hypothetical protein L208DRAFT_1378178 [Tricholoma matsutake 945]